MFCNVSVCVCMVSVMRWGVHVCFCNIWVSVCVGFVMNGCLVLCVLVFTVFCIFVLYFLYCSIYVFFCTSVRTTATG